MILQSITDFQNAVGLPQPEHPLSSLNDLGAVKKQLTENIPASQVANSIALKKVRLG